MLAVRWDGQRADGAARSEAVLPGMEQPLRLHGFLRETTTPEFAGITFYEVMARSVLNRVPGGSMPFGWTVNPYRGCTHACVYCFARRTHTYLDLDAGHDFDTRVIVKVNAGEVLRRELARPGWTGEHVAMGTNTDPYQRAEGRYRLMRDILGALADAANPFSVLTKGTLLLRDLDLLERAARRTSVSVSMSVGHLDERLWRSVEPGTPSPRARLDAVRRLTDAGVGCGVLMAPILPGLGDSAERIDSAVAAIAAAGATSVTPVVLHLRPGAREWYLAWLAREHPGLVERYERLYRDGAYAPKAYQRVVAERVRLAARAHGLLRERPGEHRGSGATSSAAPPSRPSREHATQLTLL
ncbi:Rv2578c family radical SAM protein [Actinoalloteichus caeruleus]|uniref:Rv2578c family radical SAM protein n=1 Tax=Actinoalloteichus cyanogriseus TaxID=2893586 RepID=UPI0004BF99DE|nr:Rv2578c family radical SAM protein [Actinoalloteichus caeruleus]